MNELAMGQQPALQLTPDSGAAAATTLEQPSGDCLSSACQAHALHCWSLLMLCNCKPTLDSF